MIFPQLPNLTANVVASILVSRDHSLWIEFLSFPCREGYGADLKDGQWNELSHGTVIKTDNYRMLHTPVTVFVRDASGSEFFACFVSETSSVPIFLVKKYENKSSDKV